MSARDSESGSSTYRGGSGNAGGLGNGGIGGGMGGGHRGGGAGYNGGIGSRTGLTTGKDWHGNTAFGRAGGNVQAYGTRDARSLARAGMGPTVGSFGNFRTPTGQAMFAGSPVQGQSFYGRNMGQALSQAQRAQAAWQQAQSPALVPGLLGGVPTPAGAPTYIPKLPGMWYPPDPLTDVQLGLPRLGEEEVPGVPTPPSSGLSFKYNIKMAPGEGPGNSWAGGGLSGLNRPANRGRSTGTTSINSTSGGYPALGGGGY